MKKGKFITFEGIDGSGKSTIIKMLKDEFKINNINIQFTREPGGKDKLCENIRDILLSDKYEMCYETEALLFAASRAQHVKKFIIPNINQGVNIISDRFLDSSLVFQGYCRNLSVDKVLTINEFGIGNFKPDLTIFFDIPTNLGEKRIYNSRSLKIDRLDKDFIDKKLLAYKGYKEVINNNNNNRFIIIDATKTITEVFAEVYKIVNDLISYEK